MKQANRLVLALMALLLGLSWPTFAQELDFPLELYRSSRIVEVGQSAKISCKAQCRLLGDTCQWQMPSGVILTVNPVNGTVSDPNGNPVSGLKGYGAQGGRVCGLELEALMPEHHGEWTCTITDRDDFFRKGSLHLINATTGHVRDVKLPTHITPINYKVELIPSIIEEEFTIRGRIETKMIRTTDDPSLRRKVVMNSKLIAIDEASIKCGNDDLKILGTQYDLDREFFIIHTEQDTPLESNFSCSFNFTAMLSDDLVGFYRSSYVDVVTGKTKWLAATQFQATDARRAFPCWDEPNLKATFDIKLGRSKNMTAVSNMPRISTEAISGLDNYEMDTFNTSVMMPTYLVAFLISDFGVNVTEANPNFSVIYVPSKASQAVLAADSGPKILKYFEDHFNIPYPLPKLDMVALPDFKYGAMENWGLITYRETAMLYEPGVSSSTDRERVIEVIAHELAHMWFGNLVTMKWWEDLWLNEGFATYVENIGKDAYDKSLRSVERSVLFDLQNVFQLDSLETSLPISTTVDNPDYDMTFTSLSYAKGNCMLRMTEHFLTTATFLRGIRQYLNDYAYSNAERKDLWAALEKAAKEDNRLPNDLNMNDIMESWASQAGYPVVNVIQNQNNMLTLKQKRFFINPNANESKPSTYYIPLNVAYPGGDFNDTQPSAWFRVGDTHVEMKIESSPYILNVQETGYYRVNYDLANWEAIANVLKTNPKDIGELNKAQIMDDSFNLAKAGELEYLVPLELSKYLKLETDYIPTAATFEALEYLDVMFREEEMDYKYLMSYAKSLLLDQYNQLSFNIGDTDSHTVILSKRLILGWMCKYLHPQCVSDALSTFDKWRNEANPDQTNPIHPDLKVITYNTAGGTGNKEYWNFLMDRFKMTQVAAERRTLIYAMGNSNDSDTLLEYLQTSIDPDSGIRKQDAYYVYRSVGSNPVGRRIQFDWVKDQFDDILDYYGEAELPAYIDDMLRGFWEGAKSQQEIDELEDFMNEKQQYLGISLAVINQGLDTARTNMAWSNRHYSVVRDWLERNKSSIPSSSIVLFIAMAFLCISL